VLRASALASGRRAVGGGLDERADAALTLARELQDSTMRSRETLRQLRDYLAARRTSAPPR
jgi:hypothetical protein